MLTSRKGSKVRLAAVMEMSDSNMAHRLYGKKRMDGVEASRFTERLGLPSGWLDTPHTENEIPELVSGLLAPAPRGRSADAQREPVAATTNNFAPSKHGATKDNDVGARPDAKADGQYPDALANRPEKAIAVDTQDASHLTPNFPIVFSKQIRGTSWRAHCRCPDQRQSLR
jgi:hypothetical protein